MKLEGKSDQARLDLPRLSTRAFDFNLLILTRPPALLFSFLFLFHITYSRAGIIGIYLC